MIIEDRIQSFKSDIRKDTLTTEQIFQKHIVEAKTYLFNHHEQTEEREYEIRSIVARSLGVHLHEVTIVGSAKLGYSLNPKQLFTHFDSSYTKSRLLRDKSDIDISVVSNSLFDILGRRAYDFTNSFKESWHQNEYYPNYDKKKFGLPLNHKFFEYYAKGWFRPDFRPSGFEICRKDSFEDLKKKILDKTKRKLGLSIYKEWFYFKKYHLDNIDRMKLSIKTEVI